MLQLGAEFLTPEKHKVYQISPGMFYGSEAGYLSGMGAMGIEAGKSGHKIPENVYGYGLERQLNMSMGLDPEWFVAKKGKIVPAFEVLPPKSSVSGITPFWDGFQAETAVYPNSCHVSGAYNLSAAIRNFTALGLELLPRSVWRVPEMYLRDASDQHVALGCLPSMNAYGMSGREVHEPRELKYRFAGGHIHIAWQVSKLKEYGNNIDYVVKAMDAMCGVPCVALAQNLDKPIRRRYYGLAGEYRLPQHGLEYRTLSNFWTLHPLAFQLVMDMARWAFRMGVARFRHLFIGDERTVRNVINNTDVRGARELMKLNKDLFDVWLHARYSHTQNFWPAIEKGIDTVIPNFGENVGAVWTETPYSGSSWTPAYWAYFKGANKTGRTT